MPFTGVPGESARPKGSSRWGSAGDLGSDAGAGRDVVFTEPTGRRRGSLAMKLDLLRREGGPGMSLAFL